MYSRLSSRTAFRFATCDVDSTVSAYTQIPTIEEFLARFREHASESIANAYNGDHQTHESHTSGTLTTDLSEDVYSIVHVQVELMHEYLLASNLLGTKIGENLLLEGLLSIIRNLEIKQIHCRQRFLTDMESCCAGANDFYRMMEYAEALLASIQKTYPTVEWNPTNHEGNSRTSILNREVDDLLCVYSNDAVYAVQRAQLFVTSTIKQSTIPKELFSRDWEDKYIHNEVAISLVKTMEDFLYDFHNYLSNEFLYQKVVGSLIQAVVCFYVRCLVQKADNLRKRKNNGLARLGFGVVDEPFASATRANCRMMYDIQTFQKYFHQLVHQTPALSKLVEDEIAILSIIHECFGIAVGKINVTSPQDFIVVLNKRIGANVNVTRCIISDIWLLAAAPDEKRQYNETLGLMQMELERIAPSLEKLNICTPTNKNGHVHGVRLDEMLDDFYMERLINTANPLCGVVVHRVKAKIPTSNNGKLPESYSPISEKEKTKEEERIPLVFDQAQAKKGIIPGSHKSGMFTKTKVEFPSVASENDSGDNFFKMFQERFLMLLKLHNLKVVHRKAASSYSALEKANITSATSKCSTKS